MIEQLKAIQSMVDITQDVHDAIGALISKIAIQAAIDRNDFVEVARLQDGGAV